MCVYLQRRQGPNMSPCTTGPLDHLYVALDSQCNHHPSYLSMSMEMSMEMWLPKRVEAGRTRGKRGKGLTIQPVSCDYGVRETGIANHGDTRRPQSCVSSASFLFFSFPFLLYDKSRVCHPKLLLTASSVCLYKPYLSLYLLDLLELILPYLPVCNI